MSSAGMSIIIIIRYICIFKSKAKINLLEFTFQIKLKLPSRTNRIPSNKYQNILNSSLLLKKQWIFISVTEKTTEQSYVRNWKYNEAFYFIGLLIYLHKIFFFHKILF